MIRLDLRWLWTIPLVSVAIAAGYCLNNNVKNESLIVDNGDLSIDWNRYPIFDISLSDSLNIYKSGTYHIKGSLVDGGINIDIPDGNVKLILDNTTIINKDGSAINCVNADNVVIESIGESYLEDGNEENEGVIHSKSNLTLQGEGLLKVVSRYQDAIVSKDNLTVRSGTYNITSNDDALRGKDSVHVAGGAFIISSKADSIKSDGFVYIEDGNFNLSAGDDGIHAINELVIDKGVIDIASSYEGLESTKITINNGTIKIKSTDDGINAGSGTSKTETPRGAGAQGADENAVLTINGGNIYVNTSGDGIDSNGYVYINGGYTIIDGPTNDKNGALDAGLGLYVNAGEVLAIGSSKMAQSFKAESKLCSVMFELKNVAKAGSKIEVRDSKKKNIIEHISAKKFSNIVVASPQLVFGNTYAILVDGVIIEQKEVMCN